MLITKHAAALAALALLAAAPGRASAQPIGAFRWQLQPYCNVVAVTVTQVGGVYRLEGTDDQCGAGRDQAAVQGLAFPNPDGTIGFGLTIVTAPGGAPVHVDAEITLAGLSGTWRDSTTATGPFAFTAGAGTGGVPRPAPSSAIPGLIRLQTDGGLAAGGKLNFGTIPASGPGARMMWHPRKAAFRAGNVADTRWDEASVGEFSAATGLNTTASGRAATAFGSTTLASGAHSTALGLGTTASGDASVAIGYESVALGAQSLASGQGTLATETNATAFGHGTIASGINSIASGFFSQANGREAVALGARVLAGGDGSIVLGTDAVTQASAIGTFLFADRSTTADFTGTAQNEFGVRAAGGVYLYTTSNLSTGVSLAPNGSSWAPLSDVNAKENFRDIDGSDLLEKLARIPIREWNYKAQDAGIRHVGPTAQDFRAAFGLGDFPLRINTVDADGVALAGVQALYARTLALEAELERLRQQLDALTTGPK